MLYIVFMVLVLLINLAVVVLVFRRRELQPIKVKGWKLICLSLLGNMLVIEGDMLEILFDTVKHENAQILDFID